MTSSPTLFDRKSLTQHRLRAAHNSLFLHHAAVDEVQDRLELVNKSFTSVGIVTPFPDIWRETFPSAQIVPDDDVIDFEAGTKDLIIHAMCLHWSNDPVGQIIQCRHALHNDGLFIGLMLGGTTLSELRMALAEAETATRGGLSPRVAPMAEIRDLGGLLQRAGLNLPVVDSFQTVATYRDLMHLMHDLRGMGETNAMTDRIRNFTSRRLMTKAEEIYHTHFATETQDRLMATFETLCLTGWSPDESQPKPLRPGSAAARLAEALGTRETSLPD